LSPSTSSVPAFTYVSPEYVFVPVSVTTPDVVFVSTPLPASSALTVPERKSKLVPEIDPPPTLSMIDPLISVSAPALAM